MSKEDNVADRMEHARNVSKGTMRVDVLFATEDELKQAEAWFKGKRNAKMLEVDLISNRPPSGSYDPDGKKRLKKR